MRRLLLAAVMLGAAPGAQAADLPDFLRGSYSPPAPVRNWDGWYGGGQVGYSSASSDFTQSVVGLTNFIFRSSILEQPVSQFSLLPVATAQGAGFGGFVGRNYQWNDVIIGLETNYNYFNNVTTSTKASIALDIINPAGDVVPPNTTRTWSVALTGGAAAQIKDVVTFRGRAGWATGDFLPYAFGGLAVGRMDVSRSVTSVVTRRDDTTDPNTGITTTGPTVSIPSQSLTLKEERTNAFVPGWTAGLGAEYALWGNVFMRGEWEYVSFLPVKITLVKANNLRAGIGYKF
jgi:outer membrane immunogenic protein